jgi:hypothetical protein
MRSGDLKLRNLLRPATVCAFFGEINCEQRVFFSLALVHPFYLERLRHSQGATG